MAYWTYPPDRYYYPWYGTVPPALTDRDMKATVVDRLRENPFTKLQ